MAGGRRSDCPPNVFEMVGFSETLMFRLKVFGLLLLVKIKSSKFIGKSLKLARLGATAPLKVAIFFCHILLF